MMEKIDDYFNDGIVEMARVGETIVQRSVLSEKERLKLSKQLADEEPIIKSEIDSLIMKIRCNVLKCDPLQLLNYSQTVYLLSTIGASSEFQQMGTNDLATARATEYIQSIFVSHNRKQPKCSDDPTKLFFEISKEIENLFQLISHYYLVLAAKFKMTQSNNNEWLGELIEAQLAFSIRGKRYQIFELEYFRGLLEPHNDILLQLYNTSANEIIDGIAELQYSLSQGRFDPMNELMEIIGSADCLDEENETYLFEEQQTKMQEVISKLFGIELNDVCGITGWDKDFVDAFSFGMGDCTTFFNNGDYSGWPVIDLPVQRRPFIKIDGNYYCFDYYSFSDNFYRAIQKAVSSKLCGYNWNDIQKQASESMTAKIFKKMLPGCIVYSNNYYPKNNSLKQMCENDLIIQYCDIIIIVEVKAGSFVFTSPLLDFDQHIKSYRSLIENSENQCQRTHDYLLSKQVAILYNEDKSEKSRIDMLAINDIYMISVTVDNINTFASRAEKLSFINSNCDAISISIDDLLVYQDYFDSPLYFLHYLKKRREAATVKALIPADELDHLGMYIAHNCYSMYFESFQTDRINPIGYCEDLDTYYNQRIHPQLTPQKPIQNIPALFRKMISYLEDTICKDRVKISNYLLDFSSDAKDSFSSQIEQVFAQQRETKNICIINIVGKDKYDLRYSCFVSQPGINTMSEAAQQDYVWSSMLWNSEENRVQLNLSLDENQGIISFRAAFYDCNDIPVERKDELFLQGKQRAKERLNSYISIHGHIIGRNELCPCGSGRKYKKCCGKV